ncbi:GTPase-activating protein and VPS9 domain-containing protein 1 [Galleria mellonella]|uniref:GTPase-activating protein and VPS9 domain-containing protein 1 n=1 Tax=Galleria mellonella TaxID=7137 RepID=A0ABM3N5D3_GALME|nr:GTPase-activating protein and VPS9 domain-containing protein 1 [Galleria mellonella]
MMQTTSEGCLNIAELANQLRREKIFINSERQLLQSLNEEVEKKALELLQTSWICSQQRQNLTNLITSRCESDSIAACQRASFLERTTFIDVYKVLKYKEANALGELLGWLRDSPHLVALCLLLGEDHIPPNMPASLVAGLYGSCRSTADRNRLLAVIRSLIKHQMAPCPDPRKLFRTGKCALAMLYAVFRDGHTPARQFLMAALHEPVMAALQEDEFFLDIDPDKAMERFSATDRLKKFGQPNSAEYSAKLARYRKWTVQSLYNLASKFIHTMREHWSIFPASIAWIVQQIVHLLNQHSTVNEHELHAICTDLVLTHYICPAIVNPDTHGLVDVPVSYVARFNLMQVAQILQMLCLSRYQEVEPKVRDLYSKFERTCVWTLIEAVATEAFAPAAGPAAPAGPAPGGGGAPAAPGPAGPALRTDAALRTHAALYTAHDAHALITFLKRISSKLNNNTPSLTAEEQPNNSALVAEAAALSSAYEGQGSVSEACVARLAALLQTLEPNYRSRLHDLLRKMPNLADYRQTSPSENKENAIDNGQNGHSTKRGILAKVGKPRLPRSASASSALSQTSDDKPVNGSVDKEDGLDHNEVLVIKLANVEEHDYVGLVPESKVLECYYGGADAADGADHHAPGHAPVQKRTRFSVSHDEVSLGNTSDNLEAVSEAASNHSVTSSLELETEDQNDNLSDMVSANVSGRGSPNISGRETPSSQVTDGDGPPRRLPQNVPVSQASSAQAKLMKQTRNDIDDKFCKFEIKKLLEGDETISIMSDTWSTDVLASDSETIGDTCDHGQAAANQGANASGTNAPDVSETASESAWSMDVLASDSDRNTEVDTDDCVSVAARSDSSWPRRASQPDDGLPPPQNHHHHPKPHQNGSVKRPEVSSPRHTSRPNLPNRAGGGYLSATAALSRGGELDLASQPPLALHNHYAIDNRKSILVNGYPVMTCYASAPQSPSLPPHVFDYVPSDSNSAQTESTLDGANNSQSDATSQWVDDSFPEPHHSPHRPYPSTSKYDLPSTSKPYDDNDNNDLMDRSLNSSESSFNALSVSQYDRRYDGTDEQPEARSTITDLMTRMSSATISTSANLVNNLTARIVKSSEIRTSIVSISSSRIEKRDGTSNMSLSTLSVNSAETSVSDKSSSQDVNSENVTERRVSPPPVKTASTGAIPKSISFDATAEKSQRRRIVGEEGIVGNLDELKNNMKRSGGNLLHKIKMFRQRGRSHHNHNDMKVAEEEARGEEACRAEAAGESSEDILAKYRRKPSDGGRPRRAQRRLSDLPDADHDRCEGVVDLNDPEVFNSMKRKLRVVLSNPDLHCVEYVPNRCTSTSLVEWVRAAAASAAGGAAGVAGAAGEAGAAHAAALARALSAPAAPAAAARLAAALRADLAARRPYAAYLASCRAALTHAEHTLRAQTSQVRAEWSWCARAAAAARTADQLERGTALRRLARHHHPHNDLAHSYGGELMDEKATRLTASIKAITAELKADPSWEGASSALLETLELTVERAAFARLYLHVMFPNGDGDIARDQVLHEHVRRVAGATSAARAGVAARHLWAAPYPRAQRHLRHLPVYRAPRDKLACVMRCVTSIMAVLGLTEGAAPSADDLTPVLVYVILKVNPPSLLSTIELVNALGGAALQGEALYWWTQFCAAVAYIKTMDYPRPDAPDT